MQTEIMTPDHPRWGEFCDELSAAISNDQCYRECAGAREILKSYNVDCDLSIEFFQEHGGFCDCEILLNVADDFANVQESEG